MNATPLKAPFPWFGGKSRVSNIVWRYFGDVKNYVEPFAGSLAVLLGRPGYNPLRHTETVNDKDCYLANFWRAVQHAPDEVAYWADWPVSEADLLARHRWLLDQDMTLARTDPHWYDAKIAGWWVWGLCSCLGDVWLRSNPQHQIMPYLSTQAQGINQRSFDTERWMVKLRDRLFHVRVLCGDWERMMSYAIMDKHGSTAIFLDPPYDNDVHDITYKVRDNVAYKVAEWAIENGENPLLRIAYCGYEGTVEFPKHWHEYAWKTPGGFASQGDGQGRANSRRERIWFSPHCLLQPTLFQPHTHYTNGVTA